MRNRNLLGLIGAAAAMQGFAQSPFRPSKMYDGREWEDNPIKGKPTEKDVAERKGLKEFDFDGVKIYALNLRNAVRKAKNKGLI